MAYDTQQTRDANMPAATPDERQFAHADATALYRRMRPDQRTAVGNEFLRLLRLAGDPTGDQRAASGMLSVEDVARLHTYAREHHPEVLHEVWNHPVTQASLAAPGAQAEPIEHEDVIEQAPEEPPTEDVATTGPYGAGFIMSELAQGQRPDRLLEEPYEASVQPTPESNAGERVIREAQEEGPETNPAQHERYER
jgi:hypothetical protein